MKQTIQPYQYYFIQREVEQLLNAYYSVNDPKTVQTVQALATEKIHSVIQEELPEITDFLAIVMNVTLTRAKAERALEELKSYVIPFEQPSKQQVDKIFRKVKKLKQPTWSAYDLREHTYVGFNDPGSQRKYLLYYEEGKLQGDYGSLSPTITKGICAICQKTSNVSLFLSTTKSGSDGTYTKKGNYICHDSDMCNHQLVQLEPFYEFVHRVKKER